MLNLEKASERIKIDGLFGILYEDMKKETGRSELSPQEILELLKQSEEHLEEYRRLNRDNEVSNIDVRTLEYKDRDSESTRHLKARINESVQELKDLEKYSVPAEEGLQYVWVGSSAVGLIFIIHNIVSLFTELYTTAPALIYGSYGTIVLGAVYTLRRISKSHSRKHLRFRELYTECEGLLDRALSSGIVERSEIYEN